MASASSSSSSRPASAKAMELQMPVELLLGAAFGSMKYGFYMCLFNIDFHKKWWWDYVRILWTYVFYEFKTFSNRLEVVLLPCIALKKKKCDSNTLRRSVRHEPSGCWCNCDGCGCLDFERHCIRTPHIYQHIYSIQVAIVHILKQPESSPDH